jgi:hypothetical protein
MRIFPELDSTVTSDDLRPAIVAAAAFEPCYPASHPAPYIASAKRIDKKSLAASCIIRVFSSYAGDLSLEPRR